MVRRIAARAAAAVPVMFVVFAGAASIAPALSAAAECGPGTFYDAPTDTCLVELAAPLPPPLPAQPPPAPPPPPPPTPYVSASICAPIPIVNLCVGI